jgi:ferrochelatase
VPDVELNEGRVPLPGSGTGNGSSSGPGGGPTPAVDPAPELGPPSGPPYDALLLLSFGGPERAEDVMPFLERVTAGRGVPSERLAEVAAHYHHFGGRSPINDECRRFLAALRPALVERGVDLPLYWGNRNWHPLVEDVVAEMVAAGHRRVLAHATSMFSSYSGCRQYREDLARAGQLATAGVVGTDGRALLIEKLRPHFEHPGVCRALRDRTAEALGRLGDLAERAEVVFTAHSIPRAMAEGCAYERQLRSLAAVVARSVGRPWSFAYQSRSGPPSVPWLEPDILVHLAALRASEVPAVVAVPIGFVADHMEVRFDLDVEAAETAARLGLRFERAETVGTHPAYVGAVADQIAAAVLGRRLPPPLDGLEGLEGRCAAGCCPAGRPSRPVSSRPVSSRPVSSRPGSPRPVE